MIAVLVPDAASHSKVAQLSGSLAVVLVCCAPKGFSLLICDATAWLSEEPDRFRKSASSLFAASGGVEGCADELPAPEKCCVVLLPCNCAVMPRQYQLTIAWYAPAGSKNQAGACFQAIVVVRTDGDRSLAKILCNSAR